VTHAHLRSISHLLHFEGWNLPGPHLGFSQLADWREPQKEEREEEEEEEEKKRGRERERWLGQLKFGFAVPVRDGYHK